MNTQKREVRREFGACKAESANSVVDYRPSLHSQGEWTEACWESRPSYSSLARLKHECSVDKRAVIEETSDSHGQNIEEDITSRTGARRPANA